MAAAATTAAMEIAERREMDEESEESEEETSDFCAEERQTRREGLEEGEEEGLMEQFVELLTGDPEMEEEQEARFAKETAAAVEDAIAMWRWRLAIGDGPSSVSDFPSATSFFFFFVLLSFFFLLSFFW